MENVLTANLEKRISNPGETIKKSSSDIYDSDDYFASTRLKAQRARALSKTKLSGGSGGNMRSFGSSRQGSFYYKRSNSIAIFSSISNHEKDNEELDRFFEKERNFVILSNAGKPIYALHGDIYNLSSVYATLYAMISKIQTFKMKPVDTSISKSTPNYDMDTNLRVGSFGTGLAYNFDNLSQSMVFRQRNESLYIHADNILQDSMVLQREQKFKEEQAFHNWRSENLKGPI